MKSLFHLLDLTFGKKIPLELKGLPLSKFKTKLKQHLISKYSAWSWYDLVHIDRVSYLAFASMD